MIEILRRAKTDGQIRKYYDFGSISKSGENDLCVQVLDSEGVQFLYYTRKDGFWVYQMISQTNLYEEQ